MAIDRLSVTYEQGNKDQEAIAVRIEELARAKGRLCLTDTVWIDTGHPGDELPILAIDGRSQVFGYDVIRVLENGELESALDAA
jgi:hypothetical protein